MQGVSLLCGTVPARFRGSLSAKVLAHPTRLVFGLQSLTGTTGTWVVKDIENKTLGTASMSSV